MKMIPNTLKDFLKESELFYLSKNNPVREVIIPNIEGRYSTMPLSYISVFLFEPEIVFKFVKLNEQKSLWPTMLKNLEGSLYALSGENKKANLTYVIIFKSNEYYFNGVSPAFWEDNIIPKEDAGRKEFKPLLQKHPKEGEEYLGDKAKNRLLFDCVGDMYVVIYKAFTLTKNSVNFLGHREEGNLSMLPYVFAFASDEKFIEYEIKDLGPGERYYNLPLFIQHKGTEDNIFNCLTQIRSSIKTFNNRNILVSLIANPVVKPNNFLYYLQCAQRRAFFSYLYYENNDEKELVLRSYYLPVHAELPNLKNIGIELSNRKNLKEIATNFFLNGALVTELKLKNIVSPYNFCEKFIFFGFPENENFYVGFFLSNEKYSSRMLDSLFGINLYMSLQSHDDICIPEKKLNNPGSHYDEMLESLLIDKKLLYEPFNSDSFEGMNSVENMEFDSTLLINNDSIKKLYIVPNIFRIHSSVIDKKNKSSYSKNFYDVFLSLCENKDPHLDKYVTTFNITNEEYYLDGEL